jgi:hypothetical protein
MGRFEIQADLGSGYEVITEHCFDIRRKRSMHRDLKSTIDKCEFQISDQDIAKYIFETRQVPVKIWENDEAYFVGVIREIGHMKHTSTLKGMKVEAVDYLYQLQKKITDDLKFESVDLADSTDDNNSFLDTLFKDAGFGDAVLDFGDIGLLVEHFVVSDEDDTTYWDVLNKVIYEYGYVVYQDESGIFHAYDLFPDSLSPDDLTDTDIFHASSYEREENQYDQMVVAWKPIEEKTDIILFSASEGRTKEHKCIIGIPPGGYWPRNDSGYLQYKTTDGWEVLDVSNITLDWEAPSAAITLLTFSPGETKAEVIFQNQGGTLNGLYKVDIRGDVYLRNHNKLTKEVRVITSGTKQIKEYDAKVISTSSLAERLVSGLAEWYSTAVFRITFKTDRAVEPGDIVAIDSETIDIDTVFRIVDVVDVEQDQDVVKVVAEKIAEVVQSVDSTSSFEYPIAENIPEHEYERNPYSFPTYDESQRDGWDAGFGTTTPEKPTVTATGGRRAILLEWQEQADLTNFDHFEIQVSDDQSNWYSLAKDGSDWKDSLGSWTEVQTAFFIHTEIPLLGTDEDPEPRELYYRVRRVTKLDVKSNWSTVVSAEASPTRGGDVLAGTIAGEKLIARTITADKINTNEISSEVIRFGNINYARDRVHNIPDNSELFEFTDLSCRGSEGSYPEEKFILLDEDAYTWGDDAGQELVTDDELGNGERLDQQIAMNKDGQLTLEDWVDGVNGDSPGSSNDYGFYQLVGRETENVINGGNP